LLHQPPLPPSPTKPKHKTMWFCPCCGCLLKIEISSTANTTRFACGTCNYASPITQKVSKGIQLHSKKADDVVGGADALKVILIIIVWERGLWIIEGLTISCNSTLIERRRIVPNAVSTPRSSDSSRLVARTNRRRGFTSVKNVRISGKKSSRTWLYENSERGK